MKSRLRGKIIVTTDELSIRNIRNLNIKEKMNEEMKIKKAAVND